MEITMAIDMKKNYAIFDKRQTLAEKVLSNASTLTLLAFCSWVSKDSTWWTIVTGLIFLFWFFTMAAKIYKERQNEFETKADLQKWVDSLEDL